MVLDDHVSLTWKPKQMVGMTLNMVAQELILHTDTRRQEGHYFFEFTNVKKKGQKNIRSQFIML